MTHRRFICSFLRYPWAPYNDVKNTGFIDTWVSSWEKVHRLLKVLVTKNKTKQKAAVTRTEYGKKVWGANVEVLNCLAGYNVYT